MVKRVCLFCGMPCYSSDDRGEWECPRCHKIIPKEEEQKIVVFTIDGKATIFNSREEYEEYRKHMVELFNNAFVTTLDKPKEEE